MTYDTLTMTAVAEELQEQAVGARVQRVIQPSREEIVLLLYCAGQEFGLLLSTHPRHARIHLTRRRYRLPEKPPPFCMLLRKYLTGAPIASLDQPHLERILVLHFEAHEGLPAVKLIAEIMGRRSNLVLVGEDGLILGAAKTATREQNPLRAVMPGLPYGEVPPQTKLDPTAADPDGLSAAMLPLLAKGSGPEEALLRAVRGVSPLVSRELIYRSNWDEGAPRSSIERLSREMKGLFGGNRNRGGYLFRELNVYTPYAPAHLQDAAGKKFVRMNELLDHFYGDLSEREETGILRGRLRSRVNRRKKRLELKLEQLEGDLQRAGDADRFRIYGETLLTYGASVDRGAEEAILPDLYHPEERLAIPLDPSLDAVSNARAHFRTYRKLSNSRKHLGGQIRKLQRELAYCEELLYTIERGGGASLREVGEELVEAGFYMKAAANKGARRKKKGLEKEPPLSYQASSGNRILVGRNNRQNDDLTFRIASRRDTWLHAQGLPGSHVIIKGGAAPPSESDLLEAALLAAHYSKGRDLSALAVDYTEVRHVRRAPGGRPGLVLYEPFKTIIVNPQDEKLGKFLRQHSAG